MTAVIATLLDSAWTVDPSRPLDWAAPDGEMWHVGVDPVVATPDFQPFVAAVEASVWRRAWQRASAH